MDKVDVFVIGGGGTGSDVTSLLAGRSLTVALAERDKLGGECAHYGCDPTKAMLKAARVAASARRASEFGIRIPSVEVDFPAVMGRVRRLIEEETSAGPAPYKGARVFLQEARLTGEHRIELADGTVFEANRVVLTTGSEPTAPPVPGLDAGGYWTNKEAIWHGEDVPGSLLIMGAGAIGVEFAQMYARFGSRVTLVEAASRILPLEDEDASAAIAQALEAEDIRIHTGARAVRVDRTPGGGWRIRLEGATSDILEADRLLVATGRRPCFDGHDLVAAGVRLDDRGHPVLDDTLRTTARHIWAGGDATGELLFTHVGGYEAGIIVSDVHGHPRPRDYRVVPRVTFCEPEVASVGLTEEAARRDHEVRVGVSRFSNNTRTFLEGEPAGLVKVLLDDRTGEVLGGHIVGPEAGELIHEVVAVMTGRVSAADVGHAIHAYPTRAESVRSAFRNAAGLREFPFDRTPPGTARLREAGTMEES